jgi:hypothetical protein
MFFAIAGRKFWIKMSGDKGGHFDVMGYIAFCAWCGIVTVVGKPAQFAHRRVICDD